MKRALPLLIFALSAAPALSPTAEAATRTVYTPAGQTCGGYPRAPIEMEKGFCAGLVVAPTAADFAARKLRLPRTLVELPGGDWLVSDLGAWGATKGAVWRLHAPPGQPAKITPVLVGLALPHTLLRGPDGQVYLGEMNRISRFDPAAPNPQSTLTAVIDNLPANRLHDDRHPLSAFVFDRDGALLLDVGAPSDQCLDPQGKPNAVNGRCAESEGAEVKAAIRRYPYLGGGKWDPNFTILAKGLRNSVALSVHASGTILQGENGIDFNDRFSPYDEINLIIPGHHYGWPYCFDMATPAPGWPNAVDCRSYTPPRLLLPPHSAPLSQLYYDGAMFPELRGKLLMTWHGYRTTGARLVAFRVDAKGIPVTEKGATYPVYGAAARPYPGPGQTAEVITPGWNGVPGQRPQGAPVGIAVAKDGAIWLADDKNGAVIRIARE